MMAQVAQDPQLQARIDRYVEYLRREWDSIPALAAEWDEWDEHSRFVFALEWPICEDRLHELRQWAEQGLFKVGPNAEGEEGSVRLGGELAAGGGDLGGAEAAGHPDRGVAEGGHHLRGVPGPHRGAVLVEGHVADVVQLVLNGLIANDKICFVRVARLVHDRVRRSSPRVQRRPPTRGYPSDDGDRRGGSDGAGLAHATGAAGDIGRATTLGPRLSGTPDVDAPGRRGRDAAREWAQGEGAR
jgi:hypothetical protein